MLTVEERKASLEIIGKVPLLAIGRLPILSKKTKNAILIKTTNKLSKLAFLMSSSHLVDMIELDRKESVKYKDSWDQVYAMIRGEFARFYDYKNLIYERVKIHRQKYMLSI